MTILKREYLRTDKNGTKYYEVTETCGKCNGTGYIGHYKHIENGVCFACNGTGIHVHTEKIMTPEYEMKLESRRKAREEKKLQKAMLESEKNNKAFFEKMGFNEDGISHAVLGDTYDIKDDLKSLGCKWNAPLGRWITPIELKDYPTYKFTCDMIYDKNISGTYINDVEISDTYVDLCNQLNQANLELKKSESKSEYIGNIKERMTIDLVLNNSFGYDTDYGYTNIYEFKDKQDNVFIWKTTKCIDVDESVTHRYSEGSTFTITGTVKDHQEYRGVKQTVLTRCKAVLLNGIIE